MRIGIIGPSKFDSLKEINGRYEEIVIDIARKVANSGHEVMGVPDNGSLSEFFIKSYIDLGGCGAFSLIPMEDKEFGFGWVNQELGEIVSCGSWRNQPEKLNEECDILLCLGYSVGVMAEIAYSKWFNRGDGKKIVYIVKELISDKLPSEIKNGVDIRYVSSDSVGDILG